MSGERTKYSSSILVSQRPIDATEIVRVRLSQAKLLNDQFATFFKRYYSLKSTYLTQLNNLIKQSEDLNKNIEHAIIENQVLTKEELKHYNVDAIGHLSEIWDQVIKEIKDEIKSNSQLNSVVEREVIEPLSGYTTKNTNWSEIRNMHSNLSEIAQNIEFSQEKVDKYNENPSKHQDKLLKYQNSLASSNQAWDSQAPYVFEAFESTDYERLQFLRDSLLRFQTAYSDTLNKISQTNEQTLEKILNFDPEIEIERFAKVSSETKYVPKSTRKAAESIASPRSNNGAFPSPSKANSHNTPAPMSAASSRQVSSASNMTNHQIGSSLTVNSNGTTKKSRFHLGSSSGSPEKGKLRSKVGSIFGKRKNKKNEHFVNPIGEQVPESETSSINQSPSREAVKKQSRASSFLSSNQSQQQPQQPQQPQQQQPKPVQKDVTGPSSSHGISSNIPLSLNQEPLKPTSRASSSANLNADYQRANVPLPAHPQQPQANGFSAQPYNAPTPIEQPQHSHDSSHHAPPPPPTRKTGPFGSQNLSNINEDADASFSQEQGQYQMQQHTGTFNSANRQSGNFDYQNKRLSSFNSFSSTHLRAQNTGSTINVASSLFQHADLTSPGLNASIAEVINAKFKDGVQISSQLIGEIAFNYQSETGFDLPTKINVKIDGFEKFDKIIPNNQLLQQIESNEFELSPNFILSRTLGGLKYSIKSIDAPIVIVPAWKFEPHQASVMLTVKLNDVISSKLPENTEIEVRDLIVSVSVAGNVATSALSKPQGTFNKDKSRIVWKFKEPVFLSATKEEKLIGRFITNELTKESDQGILVKFTINSEEINGIKLTSQNYSDDDPFGQEEWSKVPTLTSIVAGNYSAL